MHDRRIRNSIASDNDSGIGIKARNIDDGRCVKTIVLTFPNRLAMDEARSTEIAAIMLVTKKRDPSFPSSRLNLSWKYHTAQELHLISDLNVL